MVMRYNGYSSEQRTKQTKKLINQMENIMNNLNAVELQALEKHLENKINIAERKIKENSFVNGNRAKVYVCGLVKEWLFFGTPLPLNEVIKRLNTVVDNSQKLIDTKFNEQNNAYYESQKRTARWINNWINKNLV